MDRLPLIFTLIVAPLLLFPDKFPWTGIALAVPSTFLLRWKAKGRLLPQTPLNFPFAVLTLCVLGSVFWSPQLEQSTPKIAGTILGLFVFFAGVEFLADKARLRAAALILGVLGGIFALSSLTFTEWKGRFGVLRDIGSTFFPARLSVGSFEGGFNANPVGGSLVLFLPLLLILWQLSRQGVQFSRVLPPRLCNWLILICGLAVVCVLILSQSRGAWLGAGISFLLLLGTLRFSSRYKRTWRAAMIAFFVIAFLGGVVLVMLVGSSPGFSDTIGERATREEIWGRALWGIQDFPVTGFGMNIFRKNVHLIYPFFVTRPNTDVASAHNLFLQAAVDLGIPALIAYSSVWIALFLMLSRLVQNSSERSERRMAMGLGAGLTAYFVFQFADAVPLGAKLGIFWWMAAAIVAAMYRNEFRRTGANRPEFASWKPALYWSTGSIIAIGLVQMSPELAIFMALAASFVVGWSCVGPDSGRVGVPDSRSLARATTVRQSPKSAVFVVCALLCIPFLPGLWRSLELNRVALGSLREPESVIARFQGRAQSEDADLLRLVGNAHWQLGDYAKAADWFESSLSSQNSRATTIFKAILGFAHAQNQGQALRVLQEFQFPLHQVASFAYGAQVAKDETNALIGAALLLGASNSDPESLCRAKRIYQAAGILDSIRPRLLSHLARLPYEELGNQGCFYELGGVAFAANDLPLTLKFWQPFLAQRPDVQPLNIRAAGCHIAYLLTSFYIKTANVEAARSYSHSGRRWCDGVETWYSEGLSAIRQELLN